MFCCDCTFKFSRSCYFFLSFREVRTQKWLWIVIAEHNHICRSFYLGKNLYSTFHTHTEEQVISYLSLLYRFQNARQCIWHKELVRLKVIYSVAIKLTYLKIINYVKLIFFCGILSQVPQFCVITLCPFLHILCRRRQLNLHKII